MSEDNFALTAYCGVYCADCLHYRNKHSKLAESLKRELDISVFHKYAEVKSPFGKVFKHYKEFAQVLEALANHYCASPCRVSGGCSTSGCDYPHVNQNTGIEASEECSTGGCAIIKCCRDNGYAGCWECQHFEKCDNLAILEPRCGDMPVNNLRKIKALGPDNWAEHRQKFYVWM